jgi:hypothetical protein
MISFYYRSVQTDSRLFAARLTLAELTNIQNGYGSYQKFPTKFTMNLYP